MPECSTLETRTTMRTRQIELAPKRLREQRQRSNDGSGRMTALTTCTLERLG